MEINGTSYANSTPHAIMVALESLRQSGHTARVWYGYTDTSDPDAIPGRAWPEEHDVIGTIDRSTGTVKVPLLIEEGEDGGPHMLDHRIVRLDDATEGRTLYQHPQFSSGFEDADIQPEPHNDTDGFCFAVHDNSGELIARFSDAWTAGHWIDFMNGDRYTHPQRPETPANKHEPIPLTVEIERPGDGERERISWNMKGVSQYPAAVIELPDGQRWFPSSDEDAAALRDWLETHYDI